VTGIYDMGTSGEPMLRIFCKINSPVFTILSYNVSRTSRNILCADERPVLGYDVMILSLLHVSTSHDAMISSIQLLLAKLERARILLV
jgi:hypothetical protein